MGAGRKTQTYTYDSVNLMKQQQHGSPGSTRFVPFRGLGPQRLKGVIFACSKETYDECVENSLFGLPRPHFEYVKHIKKGMHIFLYNYSDRRIHGVWEAASNGELEIDLHAWTGAEGRKKKDITRFPAQVEVKVKVRCKPLVESQYKPVLAANYTSDRHFHCELDEAQATALMNLFFGRSAPAGSLAAASRALGPVLRSSAAGAGGPGSPAGAGGRPGALAASQAGGPAAPYLTKELLQEHERRLRGIQQQPQTPPSVHPMPPQPKAWGTPRAWGGAGTAGAAAGVAAVVAPAQAEVTAVPAQAAAGAGTTAGTSAAVVPPAAAAEVGTPEGGMAEKTGEDKAGNVAQRAGPSAGSTQVATVGNGTGAAGVTGGAAVTETSSSAVAALCACQAAVQAAAGEGQDGRKTGTTTPTNVGQQEVESGSKCGSVQSDADCGDKSEASKCPMAVAKGIPPAFAFLLQGGGNGDGDSPVSGAAGGDGCRGKEEDASRDHKKHSQELAGLAGDGGRGGTPGPGAEAGVVEGQTKGKDGVLGDIAEKQESSDKVEVVQEVEEDRGAEAGEVQDGEAEENSEWGAMQNDEEDEEVWEEAAQQMEEEPEDMAQGVGQETSETRDRGEHEGVEACKGAEGKGFVEEAEGRVEQQQEQQRRQQEQEAQEKEQDSELLEIMERKEACVEAQDQTKVGAPKGVKGAEEAATVHVPAAAAAASLASGEGVMAVDPSVLTYFNDLVLWLHGASSEISQWQEEKAGVLNAMQELRKENEALHERLGALEKRLDSL